MRLLCSFDLSSKAATYRSAAYNLSSQALLHTSSRVTSAQPTAAAKPRVVLIGWLGAQPRHLAKYADLWKGLGFQTLSIQPRISSILLPPLCDRQAASFLQELQLFRSNSKVIYHIFSNAGAIFYGTVLRSLALQHDSLRQVLKDRRTDVKLPRDPEQLLPAAGIIMDSTPAPLTPDIAARGFVSALLKEPASGVEERHRRLVAAASQVFMQVLDSPYISTRQEQVWQAWDLLSPRCPQLYLYSSCDALIPPAEVERFMDMQRAKHNEVYSKLWQDSAHCEHFRQHPQEYTNQVLKFLQVIQA